MTQKESPSALNITLKRATPPSFGKTTAFKSIAGAQRSFKGDENSPFLAPRGVFAHDSRLLVSDTGQNRVFIWNEIPSSPTQKPDLVIGQADLVQTGRNEGGSASSKSLQYPSAVWTDGKKMIVADAWNHRVMVWNSFPTENHQAADVVIGQDDFLGNLPNKLGVNAVPTASTLYWPYGIAVHEGVLFVADTGNRRVLVFSSIPTKSGTPADAVIGQEDFEGRSYDPQNAIWPYGISLGSRGELAITDTQYFRVLIWKHWRDALTQCASRIIGQKDFESNGQNMFGLSPAPCSLNWCYCSQFYQNGIFVGDTGNSRILWFENIPSDNGADADSLIGKPDFFTGSEFAETVYGTEKSMYWPFSFCVEKKQLFIADTGNHRILIQDLLIDQIDLA